MSLINLLSMSNKKPRIQPTASMLMSNRNPELASEVQILYGISNAKCQIHQDLLQQRAPAILSSINTGNTVRATQNTLNLFINWIYFGHISLGKIQVPKTCAVASHIPAFVLMYKQALGKAQDGDSYDDYANNHSAMMRKTAVVPPCPCTGLPQHYMEELVKLYIFASKFRITFSEKMSYKHWRFVSVFQA